MGLDLSGEAYANDPMIGDSAYWLCQPRLAPYHMNASAYPGTNMIGAFTGADEDRAVAARADSRQDLAITLA